MKTLCCLAHGQRCRRSGRWYLPVLAILVGVGLGASAKVAVSQEKVGAPKRETAISTSDERGTEKHPLVIVPLPTRITPAQERENRATELERRNNERSVKNATIFLAIVTLFLALFTAFLWKATVALASDAKDAAAKQGERTDKAINEAVRSADASVEMVAKVDEMSKRELRAYMFPASFEPIPGPPYPAATRYLIRFTNTGKTPAYRVQVRDAQGCFSRTNPSIPSLVVTPNTSMGTVGPNGAITQLGDPFTLTSAEEASIRAGTAEVYLYGFITYTDAFGRDWTTYFRQIRQPNQLMFGCAEGNEEQEGRP